MSAHELTHYEDMLPALYKHHTIIRILTWFQKFYHGFNTFRNHTSDNQLERDIVKKTVIDLSPVLQNHYSISGNYIIYTE